MLKVALFFALVAVPPSFMGSFLIIFGRQLVRIKDMTAIIIVVGYCYYWDRN